MVTTRRQRVVCCLYDGFSALDLALFSTVLAEAGRRWNHRPFELTLAAVSAGTVVGHPYPVVATTTLAAVAASDIVFVPGGAGAETASLDPEFVKQLTRLASSAEKSCAAGTAQLVLARAGLLPATATAADGALATALEALGVTPAVARDLHCDDRFHIAAHSLGVLPLALELVRGSLGRSEADAVATTLGQRQRALLLGIKS